MYDTEGRILQECQMVDELKEGLAVEYYWDKNMKTEFTYVNDVANGPMAIYKDV